MRPAGDWKTRSQHASDLTQQSRRLNQWRKSTAPKFGVTPAGRGAGLSARVRVRFVAFEALASRSA